jgi:hypothetical protein
MRKKQVLMYPAFNLMDYKAEGSTLNTAVLDLKDDLTARRQDGHKKHCSTYVAAIKTPIPGWALSSPKN